MIQVIHGATVSKSNSYRIRGNRLYKTEAVKAYEVAFGLQYKRHETIKTYFSIAVKVYMANGRMDLDNCLKGIMDCLQAVGAIENDSLCTHIEAFKFIDKTNPRIELELKQISGFV